MARTAPPRPLLLDVLGTIVRDPFHEDMPAFFGMSLERLIAEKHPTAWIDFESGRIDEPTFLRRFFADGRAFDHAAFLEVVDAGWRYLPGMEELLVTLARRGHPLHLFSNYPVWWRRLDDRLGLSRLARWTYVSCEHGRRKPDPRAFQGALDAAGTRAEDALFVDDRPENVAAAAALGLPAIRFVGAADLAIRLGDDAGT